MPFVRSTSENHFIREAINMLPNARCSGVSLPPMIIVALLSAGLTVPAHAQTVTVLTDLPGYKQCAASDINDSNIAVGSCVPQNTTGAAEPFVVYPAGSATEILLPPLSAGQACGAEGIADDNEIIGDCVNASNVSFAVAWFASASPGAPAQLAPLNGILGLLPDVSSQSTGFNQSGAVIGGSINGSGDETAVLWPAGSTAAIPVSSSGDNCIAVDVNNTLVNGYPTVALDCPNSAGTVTATIAQYGLLGYAKTALPLPAVPSNVTHCTVSGINNAAQLVGVCHTMAPDLPQAAYWASPTSTPITLGSLLNARSGGVAINNASPANVVFDYQNSNGESGSGYWVPSTGSVTEISPLPGGAEVAVVGLADNGVVLIDSETNSETAGAAYWTLTSGTVSIGDINGGNNIGLSSINQRGTAAVGSGEGSAHNITAFLVTGL